jgi:hypothetical protein
MVTNQAGQVLAFLSQNLKTGIWELVGEREVELEEKQGAVGKRKH